MARETYSYDKTQLTVRAVIPLTPEMSDFLESISRKCMGPRDGGKIKGRWADRSQIVRSLVRALMKLHPQIDWDNIMTEEDLAAAIEKGFRKK